MIFEREWQLARRFLQKHRVLGLDRQKWLEVLAGVTWEK
jgi:hypothetical protein